MNIIKEKFKYNEIEICFIGDFHIGARAFSKKGLNRAIKYILSKPNRYVIGMGDMVDAITVKDKRFHLEELDERLGWINDQYAKLSIYLEKIKHKIIGLLIGNHGTKLAMQTMNYAMKQICNDLDVYFLGDTAIVEVELKNGKSYKIHCSHGYGGGYTLGAMVNRILREEMIIRECSVVAMGHSHKLFCFPYPVGLYFGTLFP